MPAKDIIITGQTRSRAPKGYKGVAMEGFIANWYARITQKDIEEFKLLAGRIAETVADGSAILEIAPGPGYLAIELARLGNYKITGLDISKSFVEIAQKKARAAGVSIDFRQGDAARMPFEEGVFDFVVCRAAFKNFSEPVRALTEMFRVLKPRGQALIEDLRRDVSQKAINTCVDNMGLNSLNSLITKWTFKYMLIGRAYTKDDMRQFVSQTQFSECNIQETLLGFEVWLKK